MCTCQRSHVKERLPLSKVETNAVLIGSSTIVFESTKSSLYYKIHPGTVLLDHGAVGY